MPKRDLGKRHTLWQQTYSLTTQTLARETTCTLRQPHLLLSNSHTLYSVDLHMRCVCVCVCVCEGFERVCTSDSEFVSERQQWQVWSTCRKSSSSLLLWVLLAPGKSPPLPVSISCCTPRVGRDGMRACMSGATPSSICLGRPCCMLPRVTCVCCQG